MTVEVPTASSQWRFPGWRLLAVGIALGAVIAIAVLWAFGSHGRHPGASRIPIVVALAILPALMPLEEWVFRGIVLRRLAGKIGLIAALIVSAALFAAAHFSLSGLVWRFVAGLLLGGLYLWSQSLWPPIAAHFAFNVVLLLSAALASAR